MAYTGAIKDILADKLTSKILGELPAAKSCPWIKDEFIREHTIWDKRLARLKRFLAILQSLNPARYLKWLEKCYNRKSPVTITSSNVDNLDPKLSTPEKLSKSAKKTTHKNGKSAIIKPLK